MKQKSESYISNFLVIVMLSGWMVIVYRYFKLEYCLFKADSTFGTHLIITFLIGMISIVYTLVCGLLMKFNSFIHRKLG